MSTMNDPETVRTCADKTLTLIEMSEFSEVLDDLQNLDQLAERIDWDYFLAEACDHFNGPEELGDPDVIAHVNAVNVAADLMIQDHPQSEMDEATRAVHAQLEDLTPPEALEVLSRVRRELIIQTIDVALHDHFAGAKGPIDGLLEQLEEFGLQITEATR